MKPVLARTVQRGSILVAVCVGTVFLEGHADVSSWSPRAAARYLDQRENWWIAWPPSGRDHGTFCVSCHTAAPYALARPALTQVLHEDSSPADWRKLLENVRERVRLWRTDEPFYTDASGPGKTAQSRGTESVLNALILASADSPTGRLGADTRTAFDHLWATQQKTGDNTGAWPWLNFGNEPFEAADSVYYGASLAAVAVGLAP